ncbi:MAG TPA: FAD-dependent oxidoreductase [Opitutales bacterium]|nr:FAD-dependent oxidoreductase [Opitutales bacterium]
MARDWLQGTRDFYDVVVIGSGLAGLTSANVLARQGRSVLLLEHHYQLGGLATWFKRPRGHIFDISLHGFPHGMIKSCRKYWTPQIAQSIVQLKKIRFVNPQFDIETSFDRSDFTRILQERFGQRMETVDAFFERLRSMNFYDDEKLTTRELFEEFFPGRSDIHRLLLEPIAYANGSSLDDPAITYGIVFSNFMSKGVFTFQGGTDTLIGLMTEVLVKNGVDVRKNALVERIVTESAPSGRAVKSIVVRSLNSGSSFPPREISCRAIVSNANIKNTVLKLVGEENFSPEFAAEARAVRVNWSSCQVYMGLKRGASIPDVGDLLFTSASPTLDMAELTGLSTSSRTFSFYYPHTRPQLPEPRYSVVASMNARWEDWVDMDETTYARHKDRLCREAVESLEKFIPGVSGKIDHIEAATPRTLNRYTRHIGGTSFGTKFEGLKVSMDLPNQLHGMYHAGSVGIIMSGWLGTINYGVIVADKVDRTLAEE